MTEPHYNQNQTQFTVEQPLLQKPLQPEMPADSAKNPLKKLPKWAPWAAGAALLLLILFIAAAMNSQPQTPAETEKQQQAEIARELTPFEQRLEAARELLRQANPTVQELPFPPLDLQLRIDARR